MRKIRKHTEYQQIYANSRYVFSRCFSLLFSYSSDFAVGITVSKKVGNAVVRNKVKRRIKAIIQHFDDYNFRCVIVARTAAANADFLTLQKELNFLFKKAKLQNGEKKWNF